MIFNSNLLSYLFQVFVACCSNTGLYMTQTYYAAPCVFQNLNFEMVIPTLCCTQFFDIDKGGQLSSFFQYCRSWMQEVECRFGQDLHDVIYCMCHYQKVFLNCDIKKWSSKSNMVSSWPAQRYQLNLRRYSSFLEGLAVNMIPVWIAAVLVDKAPINIMSLTISLVVTLPKLTPWRSAQVLPELANGVMISVMKLIEKTLWPKFILLFVLSFMLSMIASPCCSSASSTHIIGCKGNGPWVQNSFLLSSNIWTAFWQWLPSISLLQLYISGSFRFSPAWARHPMLMLLDLHRFWEHLGPSNFLIFFLYLHTIEKLFALLVAGIVHTHTRIYMSNSDSFWYVPHAFSCRSGLWGGPRTFQWQYLTNKGIRLL